MIEFKTLLKLQNLKNEAKALKDQKYHKSKRVHLGIWVPILTKIAKEEIFQKTSQEVLHLANMLWNTDIFDAKILAIKILHHQKVVEHNLLWKTLEEFLKEIDGWCLQDSIAPIAHRLLNNDPSLLSKLEPWTNNPNFWMRRAALVYSLNFVKNGKFLDKILPWAAKYVTDKEWFIQKAISWSLRTLSLKQPDIVVDFLKEHGRHLKPFAFKDAIRRMDLSQKIRIENYKNDISIF